MHGHEVPQIGLFHDSKLCKAEQMVVRNGLGYCMTDAATTVLYVYKLL